MKPRSLDLRAKIITSYRRGIVLNLVKLKRERSIKPKPAKGGYFSQLEGKEQELVVMMRQYSDYTLKEYCEYWDEQTEIGVSESTMCRELQKLK